MFEAIRSKLVGAWRGLRSRGLVSLFLFELVVVTLGVLAAQGLAAWVGERALQNEVEKEAERLRFEASRARHTADVWQAALPCFEERIDLLVGAASDPTLRGKLGEPDLQMPRILNYTIGEFSLDIEREFRARYGDQSTDRFALIINSTERARAASRSIADEWATFGYLEADMGELDALDRAAMRAAGVRLKHLFRRMSSLHKGIEETVARMGIDPVGSGDVLAIPDNPVESCEEIWRNGHIWHVEEGA